MQERSTIELRDLHLKKVKVTVEKVSIHKSYRCPQLFDYGVTVSVHGRGTGHKLNLVAGIFFLG
jgi:hypothetical protein